MYVIIYPIILDVILPQQMAWTKKMTKSGMLLPVQAESTVFFYWLRSSNVQWALYL